MRTRKRQQPGRAVMARRSPWLIRLLFVKPKKEVEKQVTFLDLPTEIILDIMRQAGRTVMPCKMMLSTRFDYQDGTFRNTVHSENCFYNNRTQKVHHPSFPLQLHGYQVGTFFYLTSLSQLQLCPNPDDERLKTCHDFRIFFTSNEQNDLMAHLAPTDNSIRIGKLCACERPPLKSAVCKALSIPYDDYEHCWAVLDLNAKENHDGCWGLTLQRWYPLPNFWPFLPRHEILDSELRYCTVTETDIGLVFKPNRRRNAPNGRTTLQEEEPWHC